MDSAELRTQTKLVVSTLSFAWTSMKPELLQAYHQLALASSSKTKHIRAPLNPPVHDQVTGTQIRPSEMQQHLLDRVVPSLLPSIQAIAEDLISDHLGSTGQISTQLEDAVKKGSLDRALASRGHYWRLARNVLAHGNGLISARVEREALDLKSAGKISFDSFTFWGPLLDASSPDGGVPVPLVDRAVAAPGSPEAGSTSVLIAAGNRIKIGPADLLAASDVWADVVKAICGK